MNGNYQTGARKQQPARRGRPGVPRAWLAVLLWGLAAVLAGPAMAQGGTEASGFVFPGDPSVGKLALELEHLADDVMRRQGTFSVVDVERSLGPEVIKENEARIYYAKQSMKEGKEAYDALDLATAQDKFMEATAFFEQGIAYLPVDGSYEEALMYTGAAAFLQGDPDFAKAQFRKLILLAPDYNPDATVFLPEVTQHFEGTRQEVQTLPLGNLEIVSNPENAEVWVDGSYVGVSPLSAPNLASGEHMVLVARKGFTRFGVVTKVSATQRNLLQATLKPTTNYHVMQASLTRSMTEYRNRQVGPGMRELARWLGVKQILFGEVQFRGGQVIFSAAMADMLSGQLLNRREQTFNGSDPTIKTLLDQFVEGVVTGAPAPGTVEVEKSMAESMAQADVYAKQKAEAKEEPITSEWWFWTVIGVTVTGGVVVAIILLSGGGADEKQPSPTGTLVLDF